MTRRLRLATWAFGTLSAVLHGLASAADQWNAQAPASTVAQDGYDLHMLMMAIIVVIFVAVFAVMFYSVFAHRRSKSHPTVQFHEYTTVELLWTIVPLIILVLMAWPAARALLALRDASTPDLTIRVTGYQRTWGYEYLKGEGEGIRLVSVPATPGDPVPGAASKGQNYRLELNKPVVVPVGKTIRVLITGSGVTRSWCVPALGIKQEASPGVERETSFTVYKEGTYRGQCAGPSGEDHDPMPVVVEVVPAGRYSAWVNDQNMAAQADNPNKTWTLEDLKVRGAKAYAANCVACHQANGQGVTGEFPALAGSKILNGQKDEPISLLLNGRQGTAMAAFGTQLSDTELAAVITYARNSWGNTSGVAIQPAEVKLQRK